MLDHLKTIYLRALEACAPEDLVRKVITTDMPRTIVAIGKCAGALRDALDDVDDAFVAVPDGYRRPKKRSQIAIGGHPDITAASFEAGRRLIEFVDAHDEILFLISGGGSACVELPLEPFFDERDLIETNARLVASALKIGDINCVRKHLSAIKGGRLATRVKRSVTLVYSDVSAGALADVASGPTLADETTKADAIAILQRIGGCERIVAALREAECPETIKRVDHSRIVLIADNTTLVRAAVEIAASMGFTPVVVEQQIESEVDDAARDLLDRSRSLRPNEVLIAGGEPTLVRRGDGKGGRCMELGVRMALAEDGIVRSSPSSAFGTFSPQEAWGEGRSMMDLAGSDQPMHERVEKNLPSANDDAGSPEMLRFAQHGLRALLGTSDGVDGNSGVAAVALTLPAAIDPAVAERELSRSNSLAVVETIGETIMIPPAGNNLRDLYLLARP